MMEVKKPLDILIRYVWSKFGMKLLLSFSTFGLILLLTFPMTPNMPLEQNAPFSKSVHPI